MIYQKRGHWKTSFSAEGFATREAAEAAENKARGISNPAPKAIEEPSDNWSPLEKLRGWKDDPSCEKCNCDPCECEEEWNSVEETSSETESSMEEIS